MMKTKKLLFIAILFLCSCAKSKTFYYKDGKEITEWEFTNKITRLNEPSAHFVFLDVPPYGWANADALKNDSIVYEASTGNVIWSVIGIETVAIPVWLTGWQLFEPIKTKNK